MVLKGYAGSALVLAFGALIVLGVITAVPQASAHPPSSVTLAYNSENGNLTVSITHTVADPSTHYVRQVTIAVNGTIVQTHNYTSQPTASAFTYHYTVQAAKGEEIAATAFCSITGETTGSVIAGDGTVPEQGWLGGAPAVAAVSACLALATAFCIRRLRR